HLSIGDGLPRFPPCRPPNPLAPVPSPVFPPAFWGGPTGDGLHLSWVGPAGPPKENPGHQALSGESRPQAWLQGGTPAPPYRATSRASIY
ncbi:hypothetical protein CRENBAI_005017, partial [Crenichthys baileyi]